MLGLILPRVLQRLPWEFEYNVDPSCVRIRIGNYSHNR